MSNYEDNWHEYPNAHVYRTVLNGIVPADRHTNVFFRGRRRHNETYHVDDPAARDLPLQAHIEPVSVDRVWRLPTGDIDYAHGWREHHAMNRAYRNVHANTIQRTYRGSAGRRVARRYRRIRDTLRRSNKRNRSGSYRSELRRRRR